MGGPTETMPSEPWTKTWTISIKVAQSIHLGANLRDKQVILVTYMLEVLDGLMLDPTFNVSESPGMDVFMRGRGGVSRGQ